MSRSLVLLPTYNERENVRRLLPRLHSIEEDLDIVIIDDASPDGTGILADSLIASFPRLSVLHRRKKQGLGRAYVHGMKEALRRGYSRIVTMDADLSHDPADVPRLLRALEESDVAVGSRHAWGGGVEGWPLARHALSRTGSFYARTLLGIPAKDTTSGFRAYRADVLEAIELDGIRSRGFAFQVEILRRILDLEGTRVSEVPVQFKNREHGKSKLSFSIVREAAMEVLRLRLRRKSRARRQGRPNLRGGTRPLTISVIIPVRPGDPEPRSLETLRSLASPPEGLEVILARGECPARQRNLAAREASGDLLLFLDDDSEPSTDLIEAYFTAFMRYGETAAIGGPAIFYGRGFLEQLSAAVFSEPVVTGRCASRFRLRGHSRATDERELILSNLAIRRSAFEAVGGFDESLYPNEENLLLERLSGRGAGAQYAPSAIVKRRAPKAGWELLSKVFQYGRGRGAQAMLSMSAISAMRLLCAGIGILGLTSSVAAVPWTPLPLLALGACFGIYAALVGWRTSRREGLGAGSLAPFLAIAMQLAYASGILVGVLRRLPHRPSEVLIERKLLEPRATKKTSDRLTFPK